MYIYKDLIKAGQNKTTCKSDKLSPEFIKSEITELEIQRGIMHVH